LQKKLKDKKTSADIEACSGFRAQDLRRKHKGSGRKEKERNQDEHRVESIPGAEER